MKDALPADGLFGERGGVVVESEGIIRAPQQLKEREEASRYRGTNSAGKGGEWQGTPEFWEEQVKATRGFCSMLIVLYDALFQVRDRLP
jgi:hypothetical protein